RDVATPDVPDASQASPLPLRIVVGVVGHRHIDAAGLRPRIDAALAEVRRLFCPSEPDRVALTALSPLAEGTDRLVADAVLATRGSRLDVVLPLERSEYMKTFDDKSADALARFDRLLDDARLVVRVPPAATRGDAFAAAGRFVVDR